MLPPTGSTSSWVPGSFEIPLVARKLAAGGRYTAVVCLGCVIRGETAHFDHVAGQAAAGVMQAGLATGVPVIFGILTTDSVEQALNRAGLKGGNKGADAAMAAIEMVNLLARARALRPSPRSCRRIASGSLVQTDIDITLGSFAHRETAMTTKAIGTAGFLVSHGRALHADGQNPAACRLRRACSICPRPVPCLIGASSTGSSPWAKVRVAWNPEGLGIAVLADGISTTATQP